MPFIDELSIVKSVDGELTILCAVEPFEVDVDYRYISGQRPVLRGDADDCEAGYSSQIEISTVKTCKPVALHDSDTDEFVMYLPVGYELVTDLTQHQVDMLANEELSALEQ